MEILLAFGTLHKNWLPFLIFSSSGRDKSEGAGCGSPFSAACQCATRGRYGFFNPGAGNFMAGRKTVFVPSTFLHPDGAVVFEQAPDIDIVYAISERDRQEMRRSPELRRTLAAKVQTAMDAALPRTHAFFALGLTGHLPVTAEMMDRAKMLEVIFISAAGTDRIDVGAATERGIVVVNAPSGNANSVAEHAAGLMLALCRRIAERDRAIHRDKKMDMMAVMQRGTPLSILNGKAL